jgi:FAD-linked sulfhydryl oxidase
MTTSSYDIRMPPDVWGPIFWHTIHIVTLAYPQNPTEADKAGARKFFESLTTVLPCPICRQHYAQKLLDSPVDAALGSRGDLILWAFELHNSVNTMLGKPTITVDQFIDHMRSLSAGQGSSLSSSSSRDLAIAAGLGVLVGAAGFYAYKRWAK